MASPSSQSQPSPMPPPQAPSPMGPPQQAPSPMPSPGMAPPPPQQAPSPMGPPQHHPHSPTGYAGQGPPPQGPPHMPPHMNGPNNPPPQHAMQQGTQTFHQQPMPPHQQPPIQGGGPQENLSALQRAIDSMEEKGLQDDPRYSQLLALRARQGNMEPPRPPQGNFNPGSEGSPQGNKHSFSPAQLQQLRVQIMAYRLLARNQPLSQQLALAVQSKRHEPPPPGPFPQRPAEPG